MMVWKTAVAAFAYDGDSNRFRQIADLLGTFVTKTYYNDVIELAQVLLSDDGTT
jgi:hypothetical protein